MPDPDTLSMEHFFDWIERERRVDRPWLILGKGPTFALRTRFDLSGFELLSLNHAVREQPVLLAHMIDLDVVDACGQTLLAQARHVVLPWYPHVGNAPGPRSLAELVPNHPLLRRLAGEGRLLWYDLSTTPRRHGPGPVVQATYFSAEAAVSLLAQAGVRRVRSLGVDGGVVYSDEFADLHGRTLLANGQPAFDLQFQGIARTILRTGVDFAPLDLPAPVAVYLADGGGGPLPARVLEFSVRKRTSMTVDVRAPGAAIDAAETSEPAGTRHRAIVLHAESLLLDDLRTLWARPRDRDGVEVPQGSTAPALAVVTAGETEAFAAMGSRALELVASPGAGGAAVAERRRTLPAGWSHADRFVRGATAFLHFAAAERQPWVSTAHPLAHLWVAELLDAVRDGFVPLELIRSEVRQGRVRPSLLDQAERGVEEGLLLPPSVRRRDSRFAPAGRPAPAAAGLLTDPLLLLRALGRQARRELRAYRARRAAGGGG
ncbi:MAG TPA: hypothetical protein VFZ26_16700 [Gemmatimonadales bacterium]